MPTNPPPLAGFLIDDAPAPTPKRTSTNLAQLCRENDELISDLARFSEGICTEAAIRRKYRDLLDDKDWEKLGEDDLLIEMIEAEKIRRTRNSSAKREKAQLHVVRGVDILNEIATNPKASDKHKIDAVKALDSLADPGPQAEAEQERVHIVINLTADTKIKDPKDILVIDAAARPNLKPIDSWDTPKQIERGPSRTDNDGGNHF
jgi:hypothetical protein